MKTHPRSTQTPVFEIFSTSQRHLPAHLLHSGLFKPPLGNLAFRKIILHGSLTPHRAHPHKKNEQSTKTYHSHVQPLIIKAHHAAVQYNYILGGLTSTAKAGTSSPGKISLIL